MSYMAFHEGADKAMGGKFWGTKFPDKDGVLKDTGVQEFVETLLQILSSVGPIQLDRPLEFLNNTDGPAIKIYNNGPNVDWMGIRVQDPAGNQAQFGIGLGNEGIVANNYVPTPTFWLDPNDVHRFYSVSGDNAGGNRYHPKAVEAGNGLGEPFAGPASNVPGGGVYYGNQVYGLSHNFANYTANMWLNPMFTTWQFYDETETCGGYYQFDLSGDTIVWPTYVPQSEVFIAIADDQIDRNGEGTVTDLNDISFNVTNPRFGCVESGDRVVVACLRDQQGYQIIDAPEKLYYSTGIATVDIPKGGTGEVSLYATGAGVTAISPFVDIAVRTKVGVIRDVSGYGETPVGINGGHCGRWTIIAAECEASPDQQQDLGTTAAPVLVPIGITPDGTTSTAATFANGSP